MYSFISHCFKPLFIVSFISRVVWLYHIVLLSEIDAESCTNQNDLPYTDFAIYRKTINHSSAIPNQFIDQHFPLYMLALTNSRIVFHSLVIQEWRVNYFHLRTSKVIVYTRFNNKKVIRKYIAKLARNLNTYTNISSNQQIHVIDYATIFSKPCDITRPNALNQGMASFHHHQWTFLKLLTWRIIVRSHGFIERRDCFVNSRGVPGLYLWLYVKVLSPLIYRPLSMVIMNYWVSVVLASSNSLNVSYSLKDGWSLKMFMKGSAK